MENLVDFQETDFLILGGGLSGIGAAHGLKNKKYIIIEKSNNLLGHSKSFKFKNYYFDNGTHICHSLDKKWLEILDTKNTNYFENSDVKNYDTNKWLGYPVQNNLRDIDSTLMYKAFKEIKINQQKNINAKNYYEWSLQVYGKTLTDRYYKRFTDKYWRTPMEEMSLDWFNGRILPVKIDLVKDGMTSSPKNQAVFKSFRYPKNKGFEGLFKKIHDHVFDSAILNAEVKSIDMDKKIATTNKGNKISFKKIINTIPLNRVITLLKETPDEIKTAGLNLKHLHLITTAVVIKNFGKNNLPHWFYVYDKDIEMARITNVSRVNGIDNNDLALQLETFRRNDEIYDLEEVETKIQNDMLKIFDIDQKSLSFYHKLSEFSYVVSTSGTENYRNKIINYLESIGMHTCGLYGTWKYMWSDQSFWSGYNKGESLNNE